ncbi:hypothetical protein RhiXN_10239 [Rhizoctonia solani]|uniref:LYC1 C-terminal domain-containing protein n=1 Tax=Rhizoctonia solani TaxID=456999 RepID=A0A8H8P2E8_9AGAM|nr:uncharacterized protein RhiXN_10239 [Rhizoctonia solani]QRW23915.1 hypothetical protein RhiXN_10239 [Rhizoctonia solani]
MSLEYLIVKPANEAQSQEAMHRDAAYWSAFGQEGRLKIWVLVPKDDPETTNFYASCQILTRKLQLWPWYHLGARSPEHRRKGYAKYFMSLLHSALAPHQYPDPLRAPETTEQLSTVSILYSVVGDYYSRCIPAVGESGWALQKSFATTWPLSRAQVFTGPTLPVELIPEADISSTLDSDDLNIHTDLLRLQKKDPTKTYFAFVPTAPLNSYSVMFGKLLMDRRGPSNLSWGARIPGTDNFMTWVFYGLEQVQLIVTRLRATPDSFPTLLAAAVRTAKDTGCESIEIWNVPEDLKMIVRKTGGKTSERTDDLAGFKWYGEHPHSGVDNRDVVWALEEG